MRIFAALLPLAALVSVPAHAATVIVNVTEDLTNYDLSQPGLNFFNTPLSATLNEGDVLDLRLDFLGDQTLVVNSLASLRAGIWSTIVSGNATLTGVLTFDNPTGPLAAAAADSETGCCIHIANSFGSSQLLTGSGPVSFSGFRLVGTADFANDVTRSYSRNFSAVTGTGFSIGSIGGAVPEPSTWAMMLIGFGFVGGALRSRRRQKLTVSYA